jgi:uncharacterized protein (DUF2384 family)
MGTVQILSVSEPFDRPELGQAAIELLGLAEAMGVLPSDARIRALDWGAVRTAGRHIAKAGIGTALMPNLEKSSDPQEALALLRTLVRILEQSPAPEHEWERLQKLFPNDELGSLVGVSATSVGRYRSHSRRTPDAAAARLHFLARIIHHLEGAYNDLGVRRWFRRHRAGLDGKSPADILTAEWDPDDKGPQRVLELARSLNGAGAT